MMTAISFVPLQSSSSPRLVTTQLSPTQRHSTDRWQNNEPEALRSWREALDQITLANATRLPAGWFPKTETERALWDALKEMENQCKERVDLLVTLRESRADLGLSSPRSNLSKASLVANNGSNQWLGGGTIPPASLSDLPSSSTPLPVRRRSSNHSIPPSAGLGIPPSLPVPSAAKNSRSPSPDARKPMRTTLRSEKKGLRHRMRGSGPPNGLKAAGLAWEAQQPRARSEVKSIPDPTIEARLSAQAARRSLDIPRPQEQRANSAISMPDPDDYRSRPPNHATAAGIASYDPRPSSRPSVDTSRRPYTASAPDIRNLELDSRSPTSPKSSSRQAPPPPPHRIKPAEVKYRKEVFPTTSNVPEPLARRIIDRAYAQPDPNLNSSPQPKPAGLVRKPVPPSGTQSPKARPPVPRARRTSSTTDAAATSSKPTSPRPRTTGRSRTSGAITPPSTDSDSDGPPGEDIDANVKEMSDFDLKCAALLANLPKGVDSNAAQQIMNEIIIKGDEVHWEDVAGLHLAKKALKEAVVYPFLRPDLFMGLREPARGMLLFGPPGTGKTMLARAVATESKSTFFAITASSLTSKWHGESEKLVRALFAMAKALAPSIIFVDEIDALLNSRGGGTEHEASRRSKTEFLIQWSDLQRAAAGKEAKAGEGDATRVLVLAATNCPWDIDEAARRRFVRRQYIPLPEAETRDTQIRTLLKSQKHGLSNADVVELTNLTDGTLYTPVCSCLSDYLLTCSRLLRL